MIKEFPELLRVIELILFIKVLGGGGIAWKDSMEEIMTE